MSDGNTSAASLSHPAGTPGASSAARKPARSARRALAISGAVILGVAGVVTLLALLSRPPRVTFYVINPLDLDVMVQISGSEPAEPADSPILLHPGAWARADIPPGDFTLVARVDAGGTHREIERATVRKYTDGVIVWSLAAAAPLFLEANPGPATSHSPKLLAAREGPLCEEFPRSTPVRFDPECSSRNDARLAGLTLSDDVHWRTTLGLLMNLGQLEPAAIMARRVWRAQPDERSAIDASLHFTHISGGPQAMLTFAAEMIASGHADEKARFHIQEVQMRVHPPADVRAAAADEAAANPDSPLAGLLLARCERQQKALQLHAGLAERFPDYLWRCRDHAWRLLVAGRYGDAADEYTRYATVDAPGADWLVGWRVTALVATGRVEEARRLVEATGATLLEHHAPNLDVAVLYDTLARRFPELEVAEPTAWMLRLFGPQPEGPDAWTANNAEDWARFRVLTGRDQPGEFDAWPEGDLRTALRLMQAARRSSSSAAALAKSASSSAYAFVADDATLLVLAGEAIAANDAATVGRLLLAMQAIDSEQRTALGAFVVAGGETDLLDELAPDMQAAVALLRGLRSTDAETRRMWLQRAAAVDTPDGIARAIATRELAAGD